MIPRDEVARALEWAARCERYARARLRVAAGTTDPVVRAYADRCLERALEARRYANVLEGGNR